MQKDTLDIAGDLIALLGTDAVLTDAGDMDRFLVEPRKRFHRKATAVALPRSVAEVQAILRWANANRIAIIPQSGNTGLVGGQVPLFGNEVIVSLIRLDRVREIDAEAGYITVEAGLTLQKARDAADEAGALFPLSLASQDRARIGGVLSSNAGGIQVLAYGSARDNCLGIESVLADGRLYQGLNALRKNNTGYDLKSLLIGAEGTLGIITAATLKLFPKPEAHETAWISVTDPEAALQLFVAMRRRAGSSLTAFELVPRIGLDFQLKHKMIARDPGVKPSPWSVLAEISRPFGGSRGVLAGALDAGSQNGLVTDAVVAESEADRRLMWQAREQLSDCQTLEGASIKHDVSVPLTAVPRLIAEGIAAAERVVPGIRPVPFGHIGDGNIHFNLSQPVEADGEAFLDGAQAVHDAVYDVVLGLGGSISAEHGIGQLKTDLLKRVKDPVALEMMRAIKQALDPEGILNPGKVLD